MRGLDPIERLPDGSLFRLTPGQVRSVRGLTKRCCNFLDGDCLLLDGVCPQYISRSLLCRWFRRAVLPQQPKLEQAIFSPKKLRRCEVCGTGILARSGRTKYCPACAKDIHRQQNVFCQVKIPGFAKANPLVLPREFPGNCQINSLVLPRYFTRMRALRRR